MKKKLILLSILTGLLLIVSGGFVFWNYFQSSAATACSSVAVYTSANYSGNNACFSSGSYKLSNLRAVGIANDSISSIKINTGYQITIFRDDNFLGPSKTLIQSISNLQNLPMDSISNWNDRISSLKVSATICSAPLTETRAVSCPPGQTGSITETRTKGPAPDCEWGEWEETANSCETPRQTPSVNLKANGSNGPITVDYDASVKLSWESDEVDNCVASGGWSGSKDDSGEETRKLTENTTFVLTCNGNGSAVDSVEVVVNQQAGPPPAQEDPPSTNPPSSNPTPSNPTPSSNIPSGSVITNPNPQDPGSGLSQETESTPSEEIITEPEDISSNEMVPQTKTNWWIYLLLAFGIVGAGIYIFLKFFKGNFIKSDNLLEDPVSMETENEPAQNQELKQDEVKPAPEASSAQPLPNIDKLPSNIPAETVEPGKVPDDMSID